MAIRQLFIEGRTFYFYNDLIKFNINNIKIDKKNVLDNDVYYVGYITKKAQWNVNSVSHFYLMINRIKGHFEEKDGDKYLILSSKNGDIMQKYQKVFDGIKEIIKRINYYSYRIKYDDNYMKIKFNTNDNIILNKIIYFPTITVIIRSVTQKDRKYYVQLFLDDCLYEHSHKKKPYFGNTGRLHGFLNTTQRSCSNINKRPAEGAKQFYKMARTMHDSL